MAYILDNKRALGRYIIPEGSNPTVTSRVDVRVDASFMIGGDGTKYTFPIIKAPGPGYILKDVLGDGVLDWVSATVADPCKYEFKRITAPGTNYLVQPEDCALEIVNDGYTSVTLPSAVGIGGKIYLISRGSNTKFTLYPQPGEKIDDNDSHVFLKKYTRLTVMSNDVGGYYII